MRVDIRLLGGFEVVVDGVPVPDDAWRRRAPALLVKLLALSRGHRVRREQLMDALWPDLLVESAAPRLHKAAHYARTALGESDSVVLSDDSVSLFPAADIVVDVELFDAAVEAARLQGEPRLSAEAVELYRGELLPSDLYEPWTEEDRERLRLTHTEMLQDLGRWDLIVAADPLDEVAHLRLIQQQIELADRRAALRQLEAMEKVWQRELGEGMGEAALALRDEALALPIDVVVGDRPTIRSSVPVPPTRTVGREHDIARALELLETSQTVTLLGPGGVGKTRLAAEVASRFVDATSVECCFVDLTKVSDPALVPGLIARELGVHVESASDPGPVVEEALSRRSLLMVLDNFEHVLDAAEIARRLADRSSGVRVLSTSRARLRIAGEQVFDVAPLSLESADRSAAGEHVTGRCHRPVRPGGHGSGPWLPAGAEPRGRRTHLPRRGRAPSRHRARRRARTHAVSAPAPSATRRPSRIGLGSSPRRATPAADRLRHDRLEPAPARVRGAGPVHAPRCVRGRGAAGGDRGGLRRSQAATWSTP